jgi:hypothetical protein
MVPFALSGHVSWNQHSQTLGPLAAPIRILPSQADDLAEVCSIGAQTLREISSIIERAELTIKQGRLREMVRSVVDEPAASKLCRLIFGLSALGSRDATTISETVDGLSLTLATDYSTDNRFKDWKEVSQALLSVLRCESVYLAAKAVDVAYDFERILSDYRIITSIRPIYTDKRDRIVGNTIVQTLRLEYINVEGRRDSINIALDLSDVEGLEKICGDAKQKARVARSELESGRTREIIMTVEEE